MGKVTDVLRKLETPHPPGLTNTQLLLQNDDLLPVPPEHRLWTSFNFVAFWLADGFNINTLMIASSMITAGLSWWQAWIAVWIGYGVAAVFLVLNGRAGAVYHVSFPVVNRVSFGIFGSMWPVFNRGAMACIWYGVQAWIGGECVYVLLRAIWPSVVNIPNGLPASAGTDTAHFMCFFLFWLISLVAIWFPIHQIRHLFTVKSIVAPIAGIGFFIWCIVRAHGLGPIISQPSTVQGSALGWAFVNAVMSCISNMATLVVNNLDITSRARSPKDALLPQLVTLPLVFGLTSFLGIVISSSSTVMYGETVWDPLENLGRFLDGNPSSATRAGVAFISIAFIIAQLGVNISANSISAGCDLTALMPRFMSIRRGGYVAAIVGLAMCPWNLLSSSNNFANYLSAYSVFLSSIAGVMITDYYFIRKGSLKVSDLYTSEKSGWYWYTFGINPRAYAAYVAGILINVVGFAGITGNKVPLAATRIYELAFFTGFLVSSLIYYVLNVVFPVPGTFKAWNEEDAEGSNLDYETSETAKRSVSEEDGDDGDYKKSEGVEEDVVPVVSRS